MVDHQRRKLIKLAAGSAAAMAMSSPLSELIAKTLAIPASNRTGTLMDVEHVVIFMQENRSFDHYYGTLSGVRGYNDTATVPLPDGGDVWHQPSAWWSSTDTVSPFHFDTERTSFPVMDSLPHGWDSGHDAWNGGRYDRWVKAKTSLTMGHLARVDIPYHYELADAFTICDAYFCSMQGPTCPNRLYMMTGDVDHAGVAGGPVTDCSNITQKHGTVVYGTKWVTYAESLQDAGVSWQVYMQGSNIKSDDDSGGGMNVLRAFERFRKAKPGSPLYERGVRPRRLEKLKEDVLKGELPQVSWIIPPRLFCEHPKWPPAYGAKYIARILDALTSNPEVWSKTVFLVMYDENDGFFDHVVPPVAPLSRDDGLSTVATDQERFPGDGQPYGLGMRVPMIILSPWSRGGWTCSEVFDHTSIIRFLERRFGVPCPNISPWRRAVCGDLTSAFDFKHPNDAAISGVKTVDADKPLPTEAVFMAYRAQVRKRPSPEAPDEPGPMPRVEPGRRRIRPLGYAVEINESVDEQGIRLEIVNHGSLGAHLYVYDRNQLRKAPKRYTVEAGKTVADHWKLRKGESYDLFVIGPNGFVREYKGSGEKPKLHMRVSANLACGVLRLILYNTSTVAACKVHVGSVYDGVERTHTIGANKSVEEVRRLAASDYWYDLHIRADGFERRLAGHLETGCPGLSDPAMATLS